MNRILLISFGWLCVALGVVGVILPLLPTTPFLLLAAWAFSRSSPRFQIWLTNHRLLGPYVMDWRAHGIVPVRAKAFAIMMMSASLVWLAIFSSAPRAAVVVVGCVLALVAAFILTRPSRVPEAG